MNSKVKTYNGWAAALRAHNASQPEGVTHSPESGLMVGTTPEAAAWVAKRRELIAAVHQAATAIPESEIRAALKGGAA